MPVKNNTTWCPVFEFKETHAYLILRAEIPGVETKDIHLSVSQEKLSIFGKRREYDYREEKEILPSQLHYGEIQCSLPLPVPIQNNQVRAELINGILTVTMPKIEKRFGYSLSRDRINKSNHPSPISLSH